MRLKLFLLVIIMISCMMLLHARNSALLIGIGDYDTDRTGWAVIHGNNDVILLQNKLESKKNGKPESFPFFLLRHNVKQRHHQRFVRPLGF